MMKIPLVTVVLFCLLACGCSDENHPVASGLDQPDGVATSVESTPTPDTNQKDIPRFLSKKEQIVINCRTVQAAAEMFALENDGIYPSEVSTDFTLTGKNLIDFLPGGVLLENPIWRVRTEPTYGAAASAGQTGYLPIVCEGVVSGYSITGCGRNHIVIVSIVKDCSEEAVETIGRQNL